MSVLISDTIQKTDCVNCRVSQASYGRFCSSCFFILQTQEKLALVLEEERRDIQRKRVLGHLVITIGVLIILAAAMYARSWFE